MEELNIVYKPIKELKPYKKNAKKHSKEQVEVEVEVKDDTIKYFSDEQIIKQALDDFTPFKSLEQFVSSIIDKPTAMYQFNRLCQGYNDGYNISLLFNPHRLATGTKKNEQPIYQALNKNGTYKKQLFRVMIKVQNKFVTKHNYFKFVGLGCGGVQYVNEFQPYLARDIYRTYCKDGYTILDPCAGWGGRTIGLASCMFKDIKYLATDP